MKIQHFILSCFCLVLVGCATAPEQAYEKETTIEEIIQPTLDFSEIVKDKLLTQYQEWKGTPYKYNSVSSKGIDCSGFMMVTFKSQFGIEMPRSTDQQVKLGNVVSKTDLQIGDLVFFKTGPKTRHVGVYIGDYQFMHASTQFGVTISSLKNAYWQKTYWTSKRILG